MPHHKDMLTIDMVAWILLPSLGLPHNPAHPKFLHHFFRVKLFAASTDLSIVPSNLAHVPLK